MAESKIRDISLLRLVDRGASQAEIARKMGVSRQAVCKRLRQLRGRTTKAVITKKIESIVDKKINALEQLIGINERANQMLDEAELNPELRLKVMAEIRGQLRLQLEIYQAMFDLRAAEEFMEETLAVIGHVAPEVRSEIISRLNERKSVRSAMRWT
jgi:predicted transcriptional regulator